MTAAPDELKRGAALAKQGNFSEALVVFERILAIESDHIEALFMKGACLYKQGDSSGAAECWNRVLVLDPNHAKARNMLDKISATGIGSATSTSASSPTLATSSEPGKKTGTKKRGRPSIRFKTIALVAVVLALVGFGADMYFNPGSYSFLSSQPEEEGESSAPSSAPKPVPTPEVSLEEALAGKWFFLFQGSPATFNFYPNGRLNVVINREGGVTFKMDGTYRIEGTHIVFDVNTPEGPQQVTAYNAKISGPNFTFNYDSPDGPEILAERR